MGEEIESLYALLGIKPDEASAADAVSKLVKAVQSKLKSSVYGGKDGVITLPATLEGKFKNGKEINQDIKDAYAAIYKKAQQMADESVSLTLKDIENFKAQIDKFGKKTAKYKGSDVIANANNNLRQTLGDYQAFVNNLRKEVSVQQKAQTKQAQKAKAQAKAKTRKSSYSDISDEEINDAIAKENARQAKIKAWRDKQASDIASKLDYKSGGIDAGKTNSYSLNASEFSEYESQWARELAKAIKETYKITVDKQWIDKEYKPKTGAKSRATSREEHLNFLSNAAFGDLADLIHKSEQGDEDVTFDKIVEAIGVLRTIMEENGKDMATIAQTVINATQSRYDDNPRRKNAGVNREEGTEKGVGKGHERTQAYQASIQQLLKKMLGEVGTIKQKEIEANKTAVKMTNAYEQAKSNAKTSKASADTKALAQELKGEKSRDEKSYIQDVRESSREASADTAEAQKNQSMLEIEQQDVGTGFNTDAKADQVIEAIKSSKSMATLKDAMCPCKELLSSILTEIQNITKNGININDKQPGQKRTKEKAETGLIPEPLKGLIPVKDSIEKALVPVAGTLKTFYEGKDLYKEQKQQRILEADSKRPTAQGPLSRSLVETTVQDPHKEGKRLDGVFARLANIGANYEKIMAKTSKEQDAMAAERIRQFGLDRNRNSTDTGDKASFARSMSLWRGKDKFSDIFKDLKLSEGIEVDTTKVTEALSKVLAGKEMFDAQTGGAWRNLLGSMTGYIGMPSLEKSRSQADAVNQIMANIRKAMNDVLNDIQRKESALEGMKENGDLKLGVDGSVLESSTTEAKTLVAQLEEQKMVLASILADAGMVDQVVDQTGGKISEIVKKLGFTSPVLRENNAILANINAGLDKSGKALKFQTRTAEVLNYSFQLMARHIGQMIKNWIMMLNPLSLIKRAFQDFASYDVKWQRTMNVIKYNLRRIVKPMMEWIAQQIVNIIGLVNALMKGIGSVFNQKWDLFDQSAASAEQMREELEAASNVTASFDELHDIGTESSNNPPMDLMGDIYKPQWDGLYKVLEDIGKVIGKIIKAVSNWSFWDWLILIGAALVGFLALKWLINLFKKGNPLKSVADGFSFLEKAVGWALLIWAFTEFTKALTDFVECMKTANWEDIAKSLIMLGGAFAELVGSIILLEWGSFGMDPKAMAGLAALVWVFGEFVKAIIPFIELMWSICDLNDEGKEFEILAGSLSMLALSFVELIAGVAGMEKLTQLIGLDWQSLLGLAAVVEAFDLFVKALVPFVEAISQIEGNKWDTIVPMIVGLGGAFIALAAGVATVSKAFTAMDWKAIGQLYLVAGVFEVFMLTLVPFLHAIKDLDFETLSGGTMLIAGAFLALGGALALMTPFLKMLDWSSLLEFVVIMGVMAGLIWVLQAFVNALKDLSTEQIYAGLILLAGGLMAITVAVGALLIILSAAIASGVGALAILALAGVLAVVALVIVSLAELVRALGEAGEGIKKICEGIEGVIRAIGEVIMGIITAVAEGIATVVTAIADGITNILTPIMDFMNNVIDKVTELATTIVHEIGETIRTVIQTVGDVIIGIIDAIVNAIPNLLNSILNFCGNIGPAIENSVDAICRSITKLVNFVVSAVEYMANLVIGAINKLSIQMPDWVPGIGGQRWGFNLSKIEIPRFVPQYETGTNYVPNDGLAYLHQGEAVVPKKYNTPYQPDNSGMSNAIDRLAQQVARISDKVEQGIPVKGQFVQRGSDLVATVEKANNRMKNNVLNNRVYAR